MAKFSAEGVFYLHIVLISFLLIVFTILKNFNFDDYRESPDLTSTQVKFIYLFLFIAIISIFLLFVRGYFVKTPTYYTRAGVAMLFMVIGLVLVFSMLIHDEVLGTDQTIGALESVGILIGSIFTVMGSLAYVSLKFPDDTQMKYFKQAVKEEIRKRATEEQQWRIWQAKQKRMQRTQKVVTAKKAKKKAPAKTKPKVKKVEMLPPAQAGVAVVKCSKCSRELKVTSPDRPLTIKCPYCEAIGVIKE